MVNQSNDDDKRPAVSRMNSLQYDNSNYNYQNQNKHYKYKYNEDYNII